MKIFILLQDNSNSPKNIFKHVIVMPSVIYP